MKNLVLSFLFLLPLFFCNAESNGEKNRKKEISSVQMQKNALLLDVRTKQEFAAGHLKGAINIPRESIVALSAEKGIKKDTPLYLYCRSGRRVKAAIKDLKKEGFTLLYDLGGMNEAGKKLSLPVVK